MISKRLIIALDTDDLNLVKKLSAFFDPKVCLMKVGLQLYIAHGKEVLEYLSEQGFEIFLDLKLHDIPNTVAKAIKEIQKFNIKMTTIHSQGGVEMINAALDQSNDIKILAVSLLTSLDRQDVSRLYDNDFEKQFDMLLKVITDTNTHGIVCSSHELVKISDNNLIKVVPGIRNDDVSDDQKRIMSSKAAYENGADFIVVGRPIINSENPSKEYKKYL
jgi:orotidine-5'-phosphate decarboxylase